MARPFPEPLEDFLERQEHPVLVAVLMELAAAHDAVGARLARMQLADRPDKLATEFRRTLAAWRRSTNPIAYRDTPDFAWSLQAWLDQVERELLPKDPSAAVALFEAFIEADGSFFERADDSDGCIGDAVRAACRLWLQAAARCKMSVAERQEKLIKLYGTDDYGAREELLRHADLLLDEQALRNLVGRFETRMADILASPAAKTKLPLEVFGVSGSLSLLADALSDPDVKVHAVLSYSPQPNALQQQGFVEAYLDADRPADALKWLSGSWGDMESRRQSLLSDALGRLGRHAESAPIRQSLFERTLSVFDLRRWLEHLPDASQSDALAHARQRALNHDEPTAAAELLLEIGDDEAAEAILVAEPARVQGGNYSTLVPLAQAMQARGRSRGETVIYRALLTAILDRAYARAYGHAASYWTRLRHIAASGVDLKPLDPHEAFMAAIRSRHARKVAFWARVKQADNG